jgi:hypothetical protein
MSLTDDELREEYQRRMDQMAVNIEKMRSDLKWEARKFLVSIVLAFAATLGAGAAIGNYLARHEPAPQPMFPPGTVITIPGK